MASVSTFRCDVHVDSLLQFCRSPGVHGQGLILVTWVVVHEGGRVETHGTEKLLPYISTYSCITFGVHRPLMLAWNDTHGVTTELWYGLFIYRTSISKVKGQVPLVEFN